MPPYILCLLACNLIFLEKLKKSKLKIKRISRNMEIKEILNKSKNIAVIGLSKDESKDSHRVSKYMKDSGYNIIPINPTADSIMNTKSYDKLINLPEDIAKEIDIVNIFRKPEFVEEILEDIIEIKKKYNKIHTVWMQLGIFYDKADTIARENKLNIIMNKCIMVEHRKL